MANNTTLIYISYTLINFQLVPPFMLAFMKNGFSFSWDTALNLPNSTVSPNDQFNKIKQSALLLAFIDESYFHSKYTSNEFSFAQRKNIPILPILLTRNPSIRRQLDQCLPPFDDFIENPQMLITQDDPRIERLIDLMGNEYQIKPRTSPNLQQIYLTRLITHLHSSKGLLNRLQLPNNSNFRPHQHFIQRWQTPGLFYVESDRIYKDIRDIIESHTHIYLRGPLGVGKTSTLHSLLLEIAISYNAHTHEVPFPIYLELDQDSLTEGFAGTFAKQWKISRQSLSEIFNNPIFIFIDDPSQLLSKPEYQQKLSTWLKTLPPTAQVLIASEAPPFNDGITTVRINTLISTHIIHFLNTYLTKAHADELTQSLSTITLELQEQGSRLYELAEFPFFLTLLAIIQVNAPDKTLPFQSGQLIAKAITLIYRQFSLNDAEQKDVHSTLGLIARHILHNYPQNSLPVESLDNIIESQPNWITIQALGLLTLHQGQLYFQHLYILCFFASITVTDEEIIHSLYDSSIDNSSKELWEIVFRFRTQLSLFDIKKLPLIGDKQPLFAIELYGETHQHDLVVHHQLVKQLIEYCSHNPDEVLIASDLLRHPHPNESRDILLEVARDNIWEHRNTAVNIVRHLVTASTGGLHDALSEVPINSEINIPHVLQRLGNPNLLPELMGLLHDPSWQIRQSVISIFGDLRDSASVPALVACLKDQKTEVIIKAIDTLKLFNDQQIIPWLIPLFQHKNATVREKTTQLLSNFGEIALDSLIPLLKSTNVTMKNSALKTLAQIQHNRTLKPLLNASYDKNIETRLLALQALGNQEDIVAINRLIESLADHSPLQGAKKRISDITAEILRNLGYLTESTPISDELEVDNSMNNQTPSRPSKRAKKTASSGKERLKRITQEISAQPKGDNNLSHDYLNDPDWRVRAKFVRNIHVATHKQNIIPLLKRALQDEDTHVRLAAVDKLAELKVDQAVGGLLYAMQDRDYVVSDAAATMLQKMGKRVIPGLMKLLSSKNVNVRGMAIETMGEIGDPIVAPTLIKLLDDKESPWLSTERICDIAAEALTKINSSEARRAVTQWRKQELQSHAEEHHVEQKMPNYGYLDEHATSDHKKIITELINELRNNEWDQQVNAVKALSEYARAMHGTSHKELLNTLSDTLDDENWVVRWATIEALAWLGNASIIPKLALQTNGANWITKVAVIRALQEIGDSQATYIICDLVNDENDVVREVSAEALGQFTENPEIDTLAQLSLDKNEFVRHAAVQSLGKLTNAEVIDALKKALNDSSDYVRWVAIQSLSQWHKPELVPEFISQIEDEFAPHMEKQRICDIALEALKMIDDKQARLAVEKWTPILNRKIDDAHTQ